MLDFLIKGGLLITGEGIWKADVGITGEKVSLIEGEIEAEKSKRVIDARGKYVLPGIIDPHTHPVYEDGVLETARAAAYGGTTFLLFYAYIKPGQPVLDTIKWFRDEGLANSVLDFGLHAGFFDAQNQVPLIPEIFKLGVSSGKIFMAYAKLKWMTDDYWLMAAADIISQEGGLLMVHAENGLANDYLEDKLLLKEGRPQQEVFLQTNPDILEAEAVNRACRIAQVARCPVYIVHNSAGKSIPVIRRIKEEGHRVYAETCPQYLCLNDEVYRKFGALAKVGPPIRTEFDRLALWEGVQNGTIDTIGSDHAAKAKKLEDDFFKAPYGSPQCETMLSLIFDEGVNTGRISLPRMVKLMCENPAKIFGLYPRKGTIKVGSDADLVVFDPSMKHTLKNEEQHTRVGYTLYHGREVLGKPIFSMQRGRILLEDGELKSKPGSSQFFPTRAGQVDPSDLI
ncbi:MAG: amidohydrolase family protein [Caldiserica bacterium]|jgi:dihydropyrimidinase|nr:amidohydrolase family protein [Caldisericota bacterium]MDH7562364.1 amidohydrolase family protein [Caldisericota bacterium]